MKDDLIVCGGGIHPHSYSSLPAQPPPRNYPLNLSTEGYVAGEIIHEAGQIAIESIHSFDNVVNHLSSIIRTEQIEETKRLAIREESRRYLAELEADLMKYQLSLQATANERDKYISIVQALVLRPDLDESTVALVKFFMQLLMENDPLKQYYNQKR